MQSLGILVWRVGLDVRVLAEDSHDIPSGAMVLSRALVTADHKPMLATSARCRDAWGPVCRHGSTRPQSYQGLRDIVRHVEGWTLPQRAFPTPSLTALWM